MKLLDVMQKNIKQLFFVTILLLGCHDVFSQEDDDRNQRNYEDLALKLVISRDTTHTNQYLTIYEKDQRIQSFKLNHEVDLYKFDVDFLGKQKFLVIRGRYHFYMLDISTKMLIGPFGPIPRGDIADAQSGMLVDMKLFENRHYLIIRALDYGIYCYNLKDIYNPFEIECYVSENFPYHHFFLDKNSSGLYNGIVSYTDNGWDIISTSFLFKEYRFEENDVDKSILKKDIKDQYLFLRHYPEKSNVSQPFVIDYREGKILNNTSDKKLIKELSNYE